MSTTIPPSKIHLLPISGGLATMIPSLGAFIGGVTLPYSNLLAGTGLAATGPVILLGIGCAIGAALGDLLFHVLYGSTGSFSLTIRRMATDGIYAGALGAISALILAFLLGGQEVTVQYLASAISGIGLYMMGGAHGY